MAVGQLKMKKVSLNNAKRITCPGDAVSFVRRIFIKENCKALVAIYLKEKNEVVAIHVQSSATLNITPMDLCKVLAKAVMIKASAMILVQGNPSEAPAPSRNDIDITTAFDDCKKVIGVRLLDHIIVGVSGYTSLRVMGYISWL